MAELSKEEFMEWKSSVVTQAFFDYFNERINDEMWNLAQGAGKDSYFDAQASARINSFGEIFNWNPVKEEQVEGSTDD